jgi:RHS repeat-associated protein
MRKLCPGSGIGRAGLGAAALGLTLAALPAAAQHPNMSQGFRPEHVFEAGGIENINLFNGSLNLVIPIGGIYPVGPEFSVGFTLTYAGSPWEWEEEIDPDPPQDEYLQAKPRGATLAGLGWDLGFGRILLPHDPGNPSKETQYQSPDQALHELAGALHDPDAETLPGQQAGYATDGTYLRFQNAAQTLEAPGGTRTTFGPNGPTRIEDRHGNGVSIVYSDFNASNRPKLWTLTDDHGRVHTAHFVQKRGRMVVTEVRLEAFGGTTAVYTFSYEEVQLPRACNHPKFCDGGDGLCGDTSNVWVPLLTRVELPDLSAYEMPVSSYHTNETGTCPNVLRRKNGLLRRLDLPVGGAYEWDWEVFRFPEPSGRSLGAPPGTPPDPPFSTAMGVAERRHLTRSGDVLGRWSYQHDLTSFTGCPECELVVTETAHPPGHVTKHYFSVWPGKLEAPFTDPPGGWTKHEYGLPFTRASGSGDSSTPGRLLSRRIYDEDGVLKRTVYVRYERSGDTKANPRLASQRTVYHDDGGRRADVDRTDFDGLGHFRQETTGGTFPGGNVRTSFTNWNPGRSLSNLPGPSEPWVLDTYDLRQVSEGGQTIVQDFDFNEANGFLKRTRTRASTAGACGASDVVVERTHLSGFPRLESVYGGDGQALACGDLATLALPAQPVYRRRHTHACGVLAKTEILQPGGSPLSFLPLDLTIDCPSALVASARDTAGLQTSFSYDLLSRLTLEDLPAGQGADTTYQYDREGTSGNLPARVTIQRKNGAAVLTEAQVRVDGHGRVEEERRTLPDGSTAVRHTLWSSRGWIENRSEWEAAGDPERSNTLFRQYDPFGRPNRITLPDGQVVTIAYSGDGSRTIRVPVATSLVGGEPVLTNAATTEVYDRFGRLIELFEPNGTKTAYSYDAGGNLTQVRVNDGSSPVQTRSFSYDGRGFLTSETHPELGTAILYSDYDPLGNPGRVRRGGWDLAYAFDAAGRLTEIKERGTTRVWKSWDYATGNFQAGQWSNGKLRSASRHNRVLVPGTATEIDPVVTESYEHGGVGGRISKVTTEVAVGGSPRFEYALAYDPLGNVTSRTYPRCTHSFCSQADVARTVTGTYTQGLLTAVPGYASALSYHPSGLLNQIAHTNGVADLQERDPNDLARPLRLRTSGASEDFDSGLYAFDGAGNVTQMGAHRYVYDLLSRIDEAQIEVPGTGCGEELLLQSGTDSGTVTHESCGTVRAEGSYAVGATGNVTLRAGNRVVLGDGFSVASGGRLTVGTDAALDPEGEPTDASQSFTYDRFGNLLSLTTEREGESPETRTLGTDASTNRLTVAAYDLSGNVTSWSGREYRYDPFNMVWQTKPTNGNGHTFVYGPGDERLWTIDWTAGTAVANWIETWTLRDLDGSPLRQYRSAGGNVSGAWSLQRDYVYRGGGLLAAHTPEGLQHFHLDHLGSPRIITGSSGQILAQHLYFPFGEEATDPGQDAEALKFTGHERDDLDSSGTTRDLDYMHARYFSAHLGRFQSVDAVGGSSGLPQSWNRYNYVIGNPLKYTDPRGQYLFPFFLPLGEIPIAIFEDTTMVIESFLQLRAYDPLTGVSGHGDLLAGSAMMLRLSGALGGGQGKFALNIGGPDEFQLNLYESAVSGLDIDGQEFGGCIEQNRFDWGAALTAFDVANPIANKLAGSTGRMGFGGLGPHPTTWQHKVGRSLSRASRNPVFGRVGKAAGRLALAPTVLEGFYDIGTIGRCAVVTGGN